MNDLASDSVNELFGLYDFGLSDTQECRAADIHRRAIIVDMLFQGPCGHRSFDSSMIEAQADLWETDRNPDAMWEFAEAQPIRAALAGTSGELRRCWYGSGVTLGNRELPDWDVVDHAKGLRGFGLIQVQFDCLDWLTKALTSADVRRAKALDLKAGLISVQNASWVDADMRTLQAAHDFGLRMMQLTYNTQNQFGAGCTERVDPGLSAQGLRLLRRINELGILADTSHSGKATTLDICRASASPVVASHTSAEALYPHARAKSDEELRAIVDTGGVVGVYAVPYFLSESAKPSIETMLDHLDYICALVGPENVGLGTDRPFQLPLTLVERQATLVGLRRGFRPEDRIGSQYPNIVGFDDYRDFPNITRGLVARGYDDAEIGGILGENFLRVFENVAG